MTMLSGKIAGTENLSAVAHTKPKPPRIVLLRGVSLMRKGDDATSKLVSTDSTGLVTFEDPPNQIVLAPQKRPASLAFFHPTIGPGWPR